MHHDVRLACQPVEHQGVVHRLAYELELRLRLEVRDIFQPSRGKVVDDDHPMAFRQEKLT